MSSNLERINAARGYKAAISNPRVSEDAKQHARDMLPDLNEQEARENLRQEGPQQQERYHRHRRSYKEQDEIPSAPEDRINAARGYRAAMSNPLVSEEGKEHARAMYDAIDDEQARQETYSAQEHPKDPIRTAAGLKAAQRNPLVTEEGHRRAGEQLHEMQREGPEE